MTQLTSELIAKDEAQKKLAAAKEKAEKDAQEANRRTAAAEKAQGEIAATVKQLEEQKNKLEQIIIANKKRQQELEQQVKTEKDALKKESAQILADEHKKAQTEMATLQQQQEQQIAELQNTINSLRAGIGQSKAAFEQEKREAQSTVTALQEAQTTLKEARTLNANRLLRLAILRRTKQKSEAREAAIKKELATATVEQQKVLKEKLAQEQQFKIDIKKNKTNKNSTKNGKHCSHNHLSQKKQ